MPAATHSQHDTWASHYATPQGLRWWPCEELVRSMARKGAFGVGDRVLEVGCGNGANLWFLAERAPLVVGLDLLPAALAVARDYTNSRGCGQQALDSKPGHRNWNGSVALTAGDVTRLPFADASFDGVVDCMVSQHVPWDAHAPLYAEYRRVLRPGGWLFLYHLTNRTTGARYSPVAVPGFADTPRLPLFPDAGFFCLPPAEGLAERVRAAGFARVERRGMAREYPAGDVAHYAVIDAARGDD